MTNEAEETFQPEFPYDFNMAHYFLDARVEEGLGDRTALLFRDQRQSYREVQEAANRVAGALVAAGVEQEDRVLLGLVDGPEFVAAFFDVLKVGAVVTMVNPDLPADDHPYYLDYTRAKVLVADASLVEKIAHLLPVRRHLRAVLVGCDSGVAVETALANGAGPTRSALAAAMAMASPRFSNAPTTRDDPSVWLFTSGSTGKPKGAVHLHHDFPYNTECYAKRVLGMRPDDVTLSVPKLFFGYATGTNLLFPFAVGARRLTPPLRVTISAGEALPAELYRRWLETTGCELLDGIGSAELFHIYVSNRFGETRPGSLGRIGPISPRTRSISRERCATASAPSGQRGPPRPISAIRRRRARPTARSSTLASSRCAVK